MVSRDRCGLSTSVVQRKGSLELFCLDTFHLAPLETIGLVPTRCDGWKDGLWIKQDELDTFGVETLSFELCFDHGGDVNPLRGFTPYLDFNSKDLDEDRVRLTTALTLRYHNNIHSVVRFLGGPHTGAQRNVYQIMRRLQLGVPLKTQHDLFRIYTQGSPNKFNATSTQQNLQRYADYGNHKSIEQNPAAYRKAVTKDVNRGYAFLIDRRLRDFIPHLHLSPQGIVNVNDPWKKSRNVFDASFRPSDWNWALNDWETLHTEPELEFPTSFLELLIDIWNLRIDYPHRRILLGDNDITGAFRLVKWHPNFVSAHGFQWENYLGFMTGQTFGDKVSPANFEPIAIARKHMARYRWQHEYHKTLHEMSHFVNKMTVAPVRPEFHKVPFNHGGDYVDRRP